MKIRVLKPFSIDQRQFWPAHEALPDGSGFAPAFEEIDNDNLALLWCSRGNCTPVKEPERVAEKPQPTGRLRARATSEEGTE